MKAAALREDGDARERAAHELALVPRRSGLGESGDLRVGNADRIAHGVRHGAEPRAQHDRHAGLELPEPLRHGARGFFSRTLPPSLFPLPRHNSIPASVADRKFASVPAIMARNPRRARSCLRSGASAPIPPIWMPTELTLANPHSAKVAMVNDTGSSCPRSGPRSLYAMNSFSTMRSPSRLPIVPLSCHGTPMTQAIGRKIQPSTVW